PATYNIRVQISDNHSHVITTEAVTLNVNNKAPTADFSADGAIDEGSSATVSFTNINEPSPDDAPSLHYTIAQDPSGLAADYTRAGTCSWASFFYADDGSYTVYGRIFDKDGGVTDYSTTVTVNNVDPTLTLGGHTVVQDGKTYTLHLASSDPGTDTIS